MNRANFTLYEALSKAPVTFARAWLPSPPLSPMVKVYLLHSGCSAALEPLSGAAACVDPPQATRVPASARKLTAPASREVLLDMGFSRAFCGVVDKSVLVGETEVFQKRGAELLTGDARLAVGVGEPDEV